MTGRARWSVTTLLLAGGLLTACGDYSADEMRGDTLPEGEYPVTLTASVRAVTRSTADNNAWTGGEQVAVEATSYTEGAQPEVKIYTAAANGTLTTDVPFWWARNNEWKRLRAWYCADGSSATGGKNATAVPAKWSVNTDQRSEGYAQSDLLFAVTEASYAEYATAPVPMKFYHQTAKVVVNIVKTEYATSAERIRSLRIGGDLLLEAGFIAPDAGGLLIGDWGSGGTRGAIEPRLLPSPTDPEQYVATYEALVIPQETAGQCMLTVETALGTTLYYNAPTDAQPLAPGKVRTYNITVKVDRLEVETVSSGTWNAAGEENVASGRLFSADDLKIGDYFYSDGTWSDGGLRKIYADGSVEIASPKPAPVLTNPTTGVDRAVVGIVFQTDKSRIGAKEKEKLGGENNVHGLVMSVKNAATNQQWGTGTSWSIDEGLTKCATKADNYNDISGYGNCERIRSNRNNFDNYPAFKNADDYNTTCPVSTTTTGWYLPSSGQWWDIFQNLGGVTVLADKDLQTSSEPVDFSWSSQSKISAALNRWMTHIADGNKNEFESSTYFLSSSEYNSYRVRVWFYYGADYDLSCNTTSKDGGDYHVRPVLAF